MRLYLAASFVFAFVAIFAVANFVAAMVNDLSGHNQCSEVEGE